MDNLKIGVETFLGRHDGRGSGSNLRLLGALFSHPDTGKWGRVLNAHEQQRAIATADSVTSLLARHGLSDPARRICAARLDLRSLVVELCQPLDHLKASTSASSLRPAEIFLAVRPCAGSRCAQG